MILNGNKDGFYNIQRPQMIHNATVECKIVDGRTTAVFHHDVEEEVAVNGFEQPQSYRYLLK